MTITTDSDTTGTTAEPNEIGKVLASASPACARSTRA